jgi:hypothetical protein
MVCSGTRSKCDAGLSGVGMPLASFIGRAPAAIGWAAASAWLFRAALVRPRSDDGTFAALNGAG